MIVVRLNGGLGNQMFQYALGRQLAEIHKAELKLDLSEFENYRLRSYELKHFSIRASIAKHDEAAGYKRYASGVYKCARRIPLLARWMPGYVYERHFHFDPSVLKSPDGVYLEGYWQSEKYFNGIRELLLEEFSPRDPAGMANDVLLNRIAETNSVSLHIRRGDYCTSPLTNTVHGLCSLAYYQEAIRLIRSNMIDPCFFVFSDDLAWCKDSLPLPKETTVFVDGNQGDHSYKDMVLMSRCKHNIIANSSFSWWGAWLNQSPQKIVVTPKRWFAMGSKKTVDLIPNDWVKL